VNQLKRKARAAAWLLAWVAAAAQAQSSCSSDGQPRPTGLLERFINADCEPCWRDRDTPRPARGELALDWVAPGSRGEDAPLSAVAVREALARLEALGLARPLQDSGSRRKARSPVGRLRVAQGLPVNGYIGTSIELKAGRHAPPLQAWLLLVERLPAGTEGSPVERNLVRNVLQLSWDANAPGSQSRAASHLETRAMAIPRGADAARLRLVGWIEDDRGRLRDIAASGCTPSLGKG
jgi:hypothetical protein